MRIYVGNLSYNVADEQLHAAFSAHGQVDSATVLKDKFTGESKGFGFVEMPNQSEAQAAIATLNSTDLGGRNINVNEARPRTEGGRRDAGGGGGFGGGRGRDRGGRRY